MVVYVSSSAARLVVNDNAVLSIGAGPFSNLLNSRVVVPMQAYM